MNEVVELFGAHDNRTCDLPQVKRFLPSSDVPRLDHVHDSIGKHLGMQS